MSRHARDAATTVGIALALVLTGSLLAQSVLTQLGLTEAAARNFVFEEVKSPTRPEVGRRSRIAHAGNRAFYKLPPASRGPAATALFAWAKAYVDSPAFRTAYDTYRAGTIPQERQYARTVDEEVKKQIDDTLAGIEQLKQAAASMPPADRARFLESITQQETPLRNGEMAKMLKANLEAERAARSAGDSAAGRAAMERYPADPNQLFARRLREFLNDTTDVNFSARTISLSGGADGIEFADPADRTRPWMWQLAVIVGRDATTAARAAAEAWLREIDR